MYRIRDFYLVKVSNIKGKHLGTAKDIYIDLENNKLIGIKVDRYTFKNKKTYVAVSDIKQMGKQITTEKLSVGSFLSFTDIKDLEVIDSNGKIRGNVTDILVEESTFEIKGIIISPGFIDKIFTGKQILLINDLRYKQEYFLYLGDLGISFRNIVNKEIKLWIHLKK